MDQGALRKVQLAALMEAIDAVEAIQRRFSRNQSAVLGPRPGFEEAWAEEQEKAQALRLLAREIKGKL